ncbi:wax ester/triacylglycerol synthase domain-containing protein [Actinokineospora sp. 24-640]
MSAAERSFFAFDTPDTAQHFSVVCLLEPRRPSAFTDEVVRGLRAAGPVAPPFHFRATNGPLRAWLGSWAAVPEAAIDRAHHVRTAEVTNLAAAVTRLHSTALDPRCPLWEAHVLRAGQEVGLVFKVHHALADAQGFLVRLDRMFDSGIDTPPWVFREPPTTTGPPPAPLRRMAAHACRAALAAVRGGAAPYGVPAVPALNGAIGPRRAVENRVLPLPAVRRVAAHAGCTVNEVYLTVLGGALRSYLDSRGELPRFDLTAGVPMSLRAEGDARAANTFTLIVVELGTSIADPAARLRQVRAGSRAAKAAMAARPRLEAARAAGLFTGPLAIAHAIGVAPLPRPPYSVVASSVRGSSRPRELLEARVTSLYAAGSICHGTGLFAAALSEQDRFEVCLTADARLMPDLAVLADLLPRELAALVERTSHRRLEETR